MRLVKPVFIWQTRSIVQRCGDRTQLRPGNKCDVRLRNALATKTKRRVKNRGANSDVSGSDEDAGEALSGEERKREYEPQSTFALD